MGMKVDVEKDLVSLKAAAAMAGYSESGMRVLVNEGYVRAWQPGHEWLCYVPDVEKVRDQEHRAESQGRRPERTPEKHREPIRKSVSDVPSNKTKRATGRKPKGLAKAKAKKSG